MAQHLQTRRALTSNHRLVRGQACLRRRQRQDAARRRRETCLRWLRQTLPLGEPGNPGSPAGASCVPSALIGTDSAPSTATTAAPPRHTPASSTAAAVRQVRTRDRIPSADTVVHAADPAAEAADPPLAFSIDLPDLHMGPREVLLPADQVPEESAYSPPGRLHKAAMAAQRLSLLDRPPTPKPVDGPLPAANSIWRRGPHPTRESGPVPGRPLHHEARDARLGEEHPVPRPHERAGGRDPGARHPALAPSRLRNASPPGRSRRPPRPTAPRAQEPRHHGHLHARTTPGPGAGGGEGAPAGTGLETAPAAAVGA